MQETALRLGLTMMNMAKLDRLPVVIDIRTNELTVFTGPSGSGKSSLVFDTLYAEGQRRYVETFSAYARQFLDRMDRPAVDKVEGVPPAIAIDQTNPVRSSRSTVGTMTELNDHLKLLFARAAQLFDQDTAQPVRHDTPETIYAQLMARTEGSDPRLVVTFPVELPGGTTAEEVEQWLSASGFTRVQSEREVATPTGPRKVLDVVADRFRFSGAEKIRVNEALETARLLAKHRAFSPQAAQSIVRGLAVDLLNAAHDVAQLQRAWAALEPAERQMPELAIHAAQRLSALGGDAHLGRDWLLPVWEAQAQLGDSLRVKLVLALPRALEAWAWRM